MSQRRDDIIECFEAWWKIANKPLRLFMENMEKDWCMGSIFGNPFHLLLMKDPINNPAAGLSPATLTSEFPSIQEVGSVGGRTSQDSRSIDRMKRCITTMLLIIWILSSLHSMLYFIYTTFILVCFSHFCNFFVLITRRHFNSWHEGAAFLLLLLFLPASGAADNLSMTRISMTISAWYSTINMIVEETLQNP